MGSVTTILNTFLIGFIPRMLRIFDTQNAKHSRKIHVKIHENA